VSKLWSILGGRFDARAAEPRRLLFASLAPAARKLWTGINAILEAYEPEGLDHQPGETISRFINSYYDQYLLDSFEDYARRLEDLQEMIRFTESFESTEHFLNEVALVTNLDADVNRLEAAQDTLRLGTIHQAKGLEWGVVFVLWLAEGLFPSGRSMDESGSDEEERRLFYVTVTRAKDELILCAPAARRAPDGSTQFYTPSRFITEIPSTLLRQERVGFV